MDGWSCITFATTSLKRTILLRRCLTRLASYTTASLPGARRFARRCQLRIRPLPLALQRKSPKERRRLKQKQAAYELQRTSHRQLVGAVGILVSRALGVAARHRCARPRQ